MDICLTLDSRYSERVFFAESAIPAIAGGLFLLSQHFSDLTLALGNVGEGVTLSRVNSCYSERVFFAS